MKKRAREENNYSNNKKKKERRRKREGKRKEDWKEWRVGTVEGEVRGYELRRQVLNTHQLYQEISVFCVILRVANSSRASPNFWSSFGNLRSSCGMIVLFTLAILLKTFTASPILPLIISQRTDSGVKLQGEQVTAVAFSFSSLRLITKILDLSNELIKVELPPWKIWKADFLSVSPSSFALTKGEHSKRQLSKSFTVVIRPLLTRLMKPNSCFTLSPTQHHSFFRN